MGESVIKLEKVEDLVEWLKTSSIHSRYLAIQFNKAKEVEAYIVNGAILCKCRDERDWEKMDCKSFEEWVQNEARI